MQLPCPPFCLYDLYSRRDDLASEAMSELHLHAVFPLPMQRKLPQTVKEKVTAAAHGADIDDIAKFTNVCGQRLQEVPKVVRAHGVVRVLDALLERVLFLLFMSFLHQSELHV